MPGAQTREITFVVESKAEPLLVVSTGGTQAPDHQRVALKPEGAEKRTGKATLPVSEDVLMSYVFVGNPGTAYQITVEPKAKVVLRTLPNPVKSSIPTQFAIGRGFSYLEVKP